MEHPLFSIILPTKNRSHIIETAIKSVANQTFKDFEFVLVDNSDDSKTKDVLENYIPYFKNLTYVKTGGLLMSDNWQKGIENALGEYCLVIEDKQALKLNALEELLQIIEEYKYYPIAAYPEFFYDLDKKNYVKKPKQGSAIRIYPSENIIHSFLNEESETSQFLLPTGYHTIVNKKIINKANSSKLKRFCHPTAPDVTMAFFMLFYSDYIIRLPEAFSIITTSKVSTGIKGLKTNDASEVIRDSSKSDVYKYVPIKTLNLVNGIYNDYLMMRNTLGGKFEKFDLNIPFYFAHVYFNIEKTKSCGGDTQGNELEWKKAYDALGTDDKAAIKKLIDEKNSKNKHDILINNMKVLGRKLYLNKFKQFIMNRGASGLNTAYYRDPYEYLENNYMNLSKYKIIEVQ